MPELSDRSDRSQFEVEPEPDDVDRVLARLQRAPVPDDLTARVLASTVARPEARLVVDWPWMLAGVCALGLLALAGYQLGMALAASDGLALIDAIFNDLGLLATAPGDVLAALSQVVPWPLIVMAGLSAGLLVWASGRLVAHPSTSLTVRGRPVA